MPRTETFGLSPGTIEHLHSTVETLLLPAVRESLYETAAVHKHDLLLAQIETLQEQGLKSPGSQSELAAALARFSLPDPTVHQAIRGVHDLIGRSLPMNLGGDYSVTRKNGSFALSQVLYGADSLVQLCELFPAALSMPSAVALALLDARHAHKRALRLARHQLMADLT